MDSNDYKQARISLYALTVLVILIVVFYVVSALFVTMGYKALREASASGRVSKTLPVTVIIDPGHGGEDPGAQANGVTEKDVNLAVSLMLYDLLRANGYSAVLTRSDDRMLYAEGEENRKKSGDLRSRAELADNYADCVFVSVHMNKFTLPECKGIQVFYSSNNDHSRLLAGKIQSSAKALQPDNAREIKDGSDNIYLLKEIKVPCVLVECGFLSNPGEAALLSDGDYLRSLAGTLYIGIIDFLDEYRGETT